MSQKIEPFGVLQGGMPQTQGLTYECPVCGYGMSKPPADFTHCPCCGTEFGYHDSDNSYSELRDAWISSGKNWWSNSRNPPPGWNPDVQLKRLLASEREALTPVIQRVPPKREVAAITLGELQVSDMAISPHVYRQPRGLPIGLISRR